MKIKLLILDIDGILTDGRYIIDAFNNEYKSLNYRDSDAITWLKNKGLNIALLTGEDSLFVDNIANRLKVTNIIKGAKNKEKALRRLSKSLQISLSDICYVGDSDRDAIALKYCGLGIVPSNASRKARESAQIILKSKGGEGVIQEVLEYLNDNKYF
ncbi:MAG: HAD hydrolase family protein [Candidatus Omnitrophota bacterium]|nr:HAD hydrolase family protein [Candidatus Omnitrophota bacterium]